MFLWLSSLICINKLHRGQYPQLELVPVKSQANGWHMRQASVNCHGFNVVELTTLGEEVDGACLVPHMLIWYFPMDCNCREFGWHLVFIWRRQLNSLGRGVMMNIWRTWVLRAHANHYLWIMRHAWCCWAWTPLYQAQTMFLFLCHNVWVDVWSSDDVPFLFSKVYPYWTTRLYRTLSAKCFLCRFHAKYSVSHSMSDNMLGHQVIFSLGLPLFILCGNV